MIKVSFLKELRDLALIHHNEKVRQALMLWADKSDLSLRLFQDCPSRDNLTTLIGIWNRAILYYNSISINDPPNGKGNKMYESKHQQLNIESKKRVSGGK